MSTGLICSILLQTNLDRTTFFSTWGSAANRTIAQLSLLGIILLENYPKSKPKKGLENGLLWVDFFHVSDCMHV